MDPYRSGGQGGPPPPPPPSVKMVLSRSRPTRIVVQPGTSKSWGGTPAPSSTQNTPRGAVRRHLVVSRPPSPSPRPHPVLAQFKNDMAYAMYKLKRRGRHMERDIVRHYDDVRQMAEEHEEKEMYGNKFRRKCLKMAAPPLPGDVFSPRSTTTTTTGSCVCTPRAPRHVMGLKSRQSAGSAGDRRTVFRPSVDFDLMPPVD